MARQISLKEFQQQLAVRLREAQAETTPSARLGIQAGNRFWLLKLEDAGEALAVPEISAVPLTQSWFLGLANVRGNLVSVVDFGAFLGEGATPRNPECRLVLLSERYASHSALLVSKVVGLRNLHNLEPWSGGKDRPWVGDGYREGGARVWGELDVATLVEDKTYLGVGI